DLHRQSVDIAAPGVIQTMLLGAASKTDPVRGLLGNSDVRHRQCDALDGIEVRDPPSLQGFHYARIFLDEFVGAENLARKERRLDTLPRPPGKQLAAGYFDASLEGPPASENYNVGFARNRRAFFPSQHHILRWLAQQHTGEKAFRIEMSRLLQHVINGP